MLDIGYLIVYMILNIEKAKTNQSLFGVVRDADFAMFKLQLGKEGRCFYVLYLEHGKDILDCITR